MWGSNKKLERKLEEIEGSLTVLLALAKRQSGDISRLSKRVHKLEAPPLAPAPVSRQPLYLTETEEDIQFAFDNELINKEAYEDMLRQLEFDNATITFDYENLY